MKSQNKHSKKEAATLAKSSTNAGSPIRRIAKDEQTAGRQWLSEKHLASSQEIEVQLPGQKNRIHSVLVALPVLMLMIGLFVYFSGERAQNNGSPILSEMLEREASFKSVSEVSGIGKARYYLWYAIDDVSRGVRISENQKFMLEETLSAGDELLLEITPRVKGSNTMWVYRLVVEGKDVIVPDESS